jgi:hypothetical protein
MWHPGLFLDVWSCGASASAHLLFAAGSRLDSVRVSFISDCEKTGLTVAFSTRSRPRFGNVIPAAVAAD